MRPMVTETIDQYISKTDPACFDVVSGFSAFFPVEVITGPIRRTTCSVA